MEGTLTAKHLDIAKSDGSGTEVVRLLKGLVCAVLLLGVSTAVIAADFTMKNGSTLNGDISRSNINTATITLTNGRSLMVGYQDIDKITVNVDDVGEVSGDLEGWSDGVYEISDGERRFLVEGRTLVSVDDIQPDQQQQQQVAAATSTIEAPEQVQPPEPPSLSRDSAKARGYYIATDQPEAASYSAGVGISTLVKMRLLPESGIDLQIVSTTRSEEKVKLLSDNWAEFALLSNFSDSGAYDDLRSIATLWRNDDQITELVARYDVDEAAVYAITEVIFDNLPFLERISPVFSGTSLDRALVNLELPLHPGAKRYYDERILTPTTTEAVDSSIIDATGQNGTTTSAN